MKKLLFMPLMMLLTSCGEGGSFLRANNSLGLASLSVSDFLSARVSGLSMQ